MASQPFYSAEVYTNLQYDRLIIQSLARVILGEL